ncbi:MAG: UDP-N-acetylmuramate dehydrogenase [Lachnospiraceae bacterium]|nr:UDP-N-acetylmuramate dehydrogenase [Lachnospiraceae bacterium]
MNPFFLKQLNSLVGEENILTDEDMSKHTSFKTGGPADIFVRPRTEETASELVWYLNETGRDYFILGNGSNLLVSDLGYRGVVIDLSYLDGIEVNGNIITAQTGASLSKVSHLAAKEGLRGMEGLSGIPGSVGGAAVMNAGAYGDEMSMVVKSVRVAAGKGGSGTISKKDLKYGYRTSVFRTRKATILSVEFELEKGDRDEINEKIREYTESRRKKQPLDKPSAGSTFKRPEGHFAGKLIMDAGLSGFTVGGAKVSEKHCGFIINTGKATSADIYDLICEVREKVYARFGIRLEPEVCMLGEFQGGV